MKIFFLNDTINKIFPSYQLVNSFFLTTHYCLDDSTKLPSIGKRLVLDDDGKISERIVRVKDLGRCEERGKGV